MPVRGVSSMSRTPASLQRRERGLDVGHLVGDVVQAGAVLGQELADRRVGAERPQQLDVVLADVEQHRLDALLGRRSRGGRASCRRSARRARCAASRSSTATPMWSIRSNMRRSRSTLYSALSRARLAWMLAALSCVALAPGRLGRSPRPDAGGRSPRRVRGDPEAALRVRPDQDQARAEHDRVRAEPTSSRRSPATSRASSRTSIRRDGDVPPVDEIHLHHGVWLDAQLPDVRGGRGEDDLPVPARATATATTRGPLGHEPHDPQPAAQQGQRVPDVRHRLRPADAPGAQQIKAGQAAVDGRRRDQAPTRCSTSSASGAAADGKYTFPNDVATAARAREDRRRPPLQSPTAT